jgi:hypothetical protein
VLNGIIRAPIVRPDGSVLTAPGYDTATGILFHSNHEWSGPADLSHVAARKAATQLGEPFKEFRFSQPAGTSVVVSAILTGLQRRLLDTAPAHAFDANSWGSGKTLLAKCISLIVTGAKPTATAVEKDDEAEVRKMLISVLIAGDQII